jgi:hypothetical protein
MLLGGRSDRSYESAISHSYLVMYYGPEFVAEKIQDWIKTRPTDTYFIEPWFAGMIPTPEPSFGLMLLFGAGGLAGLAALKGGV